MHARSIDIAIVWAILMMYYLNKFIKVTKLTYKTGSYIQSLKPTHYIQDIFTCNEPNSNTEVYYNYVRSLIGDALIQQLNLLHTYHTNGYDLVDGNTHTFTRSPNHCTKHL